MTLIVVGKYWRARRRKQINKTFGTLKGKRETPAPVPDAAAAGGIGEHMTDAVRRDRLSIMWDTPWQPIRESAALLRYWQADLAREALLWHIQQELTKITRKILVWGLTAGFCSCARSAIINIESPNDKLNTNLSRWRMNWRKYATKVCRKRVYCAGGAEKSRIAQKLFATYARTDTIF